ncbi:MAG: RNA polymerase sigma factor [Candidatus Azobacteroides sp.]|nr:RNA polymerase sigma factor [Candidatus Azobacteroides sp.]
MTLFRNDKKSPMFQKELYQLHYRRIYNTCLRIIGNSRDAEEAMHDVFLKLFDNMDHLQDEEAFYSWSRSIAIRTSIDRVRKKKPAFESLDNLSVADEEPDEEPPELSVESVKRELNNLPDGYRIVVSMRLFEDCEFEEIAQALQIKESTARSQYIRGRNKLAEMLKSKIINR